MKKLILPQPWASMAAAGVIQIIHSDEIWDKQCCPVCIYAKPSADYENPNEACLELQQEVSLQKLLGTIPEQCEMPYDCFIGTALASPVEDNFASKLLLSYGGGKNRICLEHARTLDNPMDEKSFYQFVRERSKKELHYPPEHEVFTSCVMRAGNRLVIPVNNSVFESAQNGLPIILEITKKVKLQVMDYSGNLNPFEEVVITNFNRMKCFRWDERNCMQFYKGRTDKPKLYKSLRSKEPQPRQFLLIWLEEQI